MHIKFSLFKKITIQQKIFILNLLILKIKLDFIIK
jgi:hypothetical protein